MTIFSKAKNEIRERGMHKHGLIGKNGELCALSAVYQAADPTWISQVQGLPSDAVRKIQVSDEMKTLAAVITENYPDRLIDNRFRPDHFLAPIHIFNDHEDTTEDEVIAMYEKADAKVQEMV